MSEKEKDVFGQEVSPEELNAVSGGAAVLPECGKSARETPECGRVAFGWDDEENSCTRDHYRSIDGGNGFPNCVATVEDSERYNSCGYADACRSATVEYQGMKVCHNAWH